MTQSERMEQAAGVLAAAALSAQENGFDKKGAEALFRIKQYVAMIEEAAGKGGVK